MTREGASAGANLRLFRGLLAATSIVAWLSLGSQVRVLIGSRGLLPAEDVLRAIADTPFSDAPVLFHAGGGDGQLVLGTAIGVALSTCALLGILPRLCFAASTLLYLSYALLCRNFLSFQWDNLLLECSALALFVPARGSSPLALFLLRVLLFKLYFESGIAKYLSYLGDWKDGSAMRYYYETAPIPTWLAWYAHHLPPRWHAFESWGALGFELGVPFFIFFGRKGRLVASLVFAGFQTLNILTANYGFFSYLALVLQAVLLDDSDVARAARFVRQSRAVDRAGRSFRVARALWRRRARRFSPARAARRFLRTEDGRTVLFLGRLGGSAVVIVGYVGASLAGGLANFAGGSNDGVLGSIAGVLEPYRVVNTYHLFGSITRDRIEPTFETSDGAPFVEHELRYKPGDPKRAPPFVAPHQPRIDFLLWFYGLSYERGTPLYVRNLLARICHDPDAVRALFVDPLPPRPTAARIVFERYHFTTTEQRRETGAWWTRERLPGDVTMSCEP